MGKQQFRAVKAVAVGKPRAATAPAATSGACACKPTQAQPAEAEAVTDPSDAERRALAAGISGRVINAVRAMSAAAIDQLRAAINQRLGIVAPPPDLGDAIRAARAGKAQPASDRTERLRSAMAPSPVGPAPAAPRTAASDRTVPSPDSNAPIVAKRSKR